MPKLTPPRPMNTSAKHKLLDCPVCNQEIVAEISVGATFGEAVFNGPQDVTLPVQTELLAYNVSHACPGPASDGAAEEASA